jgi:hypothetical protein
VNLLEPCRSVAQRLEQPGLAYPGVAHDLDQSACAQSRAGERLADYAKFGIAAGQRQSLQRHLARPRAFGASDRPRHNRLRLSLHRERLELGRFEQRVGTVQHVGRRIDMARLGLGHQPCGQVHGVAHDRIRAAISGPDVTGEYRPAMDSDPERIGRSLPTILRSASSIRSSSLPSPSARRW